MAEHETNLTKALAEFVRQETAIPAPPTKGSPGWLSLLLLAILAMDVALTVTFFQKLLDASWWGVFTKIAPYVLGTLVIAKIDDIRDRLVKGKPKPKFYVPVVSAFPVLLMLVYVLPREDVNIPVRVDDSAQLELNGSPKILEAPPTDSAPYSGTVALPLFGTDAPTISVARTVQDSFRNQPVELHDRYVFGFMDRISALLSLRVPEDFILELPSSYPVIFQLDSAREGATLDISGRFPVAYLRNAEESQVVVIQRYSRPLRASRDSRFSTDSASLSHQIATGDAMWRVLLPRVQPPQDSLRVVLKVKDSVVKICRFLVEPRVQRVEVDVGKCIVR
jgi:hypothetical protein